MYRNYYSQRERERERELEREGVGYSYINGAMFGGNYYSYTAVIGYLTHKFVFEKMLQLMCFRVYFGKKIYNMSSKMFIFYNIYLCLKNK